MPAVRQKCRSRVRPVEAPIDDTPPAPARLVHPRRLGGARRWRGQRDRAGPHPGLGRADTALAACDARRQRALCRAARRADGQFRGRPYQSRRRPGRHAGFAAHRPGDRRRVAGQAPGASRVHRQGEGERRRGACHRAVVAGRRAFAPGSDRGAGRDARRRRRSGRGARAARRARHAAEIGARLSEEIPGRISPGTAISGSRPSPGAITAWTATSAGTASRRPIGC